MEQLHALQHQRADGDVRSSPFNFTAASLYKINYIHISFTGQLADEPTCGQSSRGLDNSRTGQLADSKFLKNMKLLYFIWVYGQNGDKSKQRHRNGDRNGYI